MGKILHHVGDICFSYIDSDNCGGYKDGEMFPIEDHPLGGIKIHIYRREPHEKLQNNDKGLY